MSDQLKIGVKQLNNAAAEWGDGNFCSITSWHNEEGADITFHNIPSISVDSTQLYALLAVLNNYIMVNNIKPSGLSFMPMQPAPAPTPPPTPEQHKSEPAPEPIPISLETMPVEQPPETKDEFSGIIPNEDVLNKKKTIRIASLEKLINEILGFGEYLDKECEALYPIVLEHETTRGSDEASQKIQAELERRLDLINFVRNMFKEQIESKLIYEDAN